MTNSEENHIKAIFHLSEEGIKIASTNEIAKRMNTRPSSVTDMIKKLSKKGLVNHKKYKGTFLTTKGKKRALQIVRKHRLWETFMVEKLKFNWDEVHEIAEQLEHINSEKLINKLDEFLGFPKVDPHGDTIPKKDGSYEKQEKIRLSELPIGNVGVCVGLGDSSTAFFRFLDKYKIALGSTIKVLNKEEFDKSMDISISGKSFHISHQIAYNLYINIKH
ncbi:metal-dependent transcriptional regulator [Aquimarina sp. 2-A2]|jgi:DtxR family Mn-dependent transcriptional regulator|uniref:metal-dependent transcriptional regulator n=1 Tax=Aquimarina sp. 2-A2 TaxID=3382644 RepID=UPI00387F2954